MIEEQLQVGEVEPVEEQELLQRVASNEVMMGGVGSAVGNFISMNQNIAGIDVNTHSILKGFTFGTSDYTGAFKSGDIEWNKDTGAITGGSGIVMYRNGIVGAAAGVTTFSINATTGAVALSGTITAAAGTIGGWTILTGYIYSLVSGTPTATPSNGLVLKSGATAVITVYENTEKRVEVGYLSAGVFGIKGYADDGTTVIFELSDTQKYFDGGYLGAGTVTSAKTRISIRGWTHNVRFYPTSNETVSWASGNIELADGTTYSIDSGFTGTISANTFIYLDIDESTTVLQITSTAATAVGDNKILVATATNIVDATKYAIINSFSTDLETRGGTYVSVSQLATNAVTANEIVANTITASEIEAGTITATEITGTTLSAIYADLGTITAGNITLDASGYIRGGQTAYNTGTGFWIGYDTSAYKLSIGDPAAEHMRWDGSNLYVNNTRLLNETIYGDGSDGDLTTSGDVTLTADTYYDTLTISTGDVVYPAGYRLFCKTKLIFVGTGKVDRSGNDGAASVSSAGGAGGAALADGTLKGSSAGGAGGGDGSNGDNGVAAAVSIGASGVAGGDAGALYTGGTAGIATASPTKPRAYPFCVQLAYIADNIVPQLMDSSGGSGGGAGAAGAGVGGGGGAGSAGGILLIVAREIENAGAIEAHGGNGGKGRDTDNYAGGGGGGGSGGVIVLIYNKYSGAGTKTVTAGTGGAGGVGSQGNGEAGDNGNAGVLIELNF